MKRLFLLSALVALSVAQQYQNDPKNAAILSDARYLTGDGKFGSAYKQEDGVEFKEESDVDGTRRGSYSYVDPSGQRRTISYTAGKNGFQASGDHLPVGPAPSLPVAPQPQYTPLPQYNSPNTNWEQLDNNNYDDQQYNNPPPQRQQWNSNPQPQQQWNSNPQPQQQYNSNPQPQQQWNSNPQPQQQWNSNPQPQQQWNSNPQPQQQWNSNPEPQQQWNSNPQPQQQWNARTTTPAPHRFYPPGKLNLERSPDGFSYTFSKS